MTFRFEFEWESPGGARGRELRATWARLCIRVNGESVTRVLDQESNGARDGVYGPLYPLAEWVAFNWWPLLNETPRSTSRDFDARHNLRTAGEGFALPDLCLFPTGDFVQAVWKSVRSPAQRVEFLSRGTQRLPRAAVREELERVVGAVLGRLYDQDVRETPLREEWEALKNTSPPERDYCERAGALGLDPYDVPEATQAAIEEAANTLPSPLHEEFFHAADAQGLAVERDWVVHGLQRIRASTTNGTALERLRREAPKAHGHDLPWEEGYECAEDYRQRLGLAPRPASVSLAELCGGTEAGSLLLADPDPLLRAFDALVGISGTGGPGILVKRRPESSKRFAFCRALFEFVYSPGGAPALVAAAESDRQKRNRAFAAELLVPAKVLQKSLDQATVSPDDIDDLAALFEVSPQVIRYQIENHRLGRIGPLE